MGVHRASRMLLGSIDLKSETASIFNQIMLSKALITREHKGIFSILPIELNALGAYKINMPALGSKELWERCGRWERFQTELFQLTDKTGQIYCLQPTQEEMVARIVAEQGELRLDAFPLMLYQTGPKFRDEVTVGYGLLRSREFLMNDLYTFHVTQTDASETYERVADAYDRILRKRLGVEPYVVRADAGQIGGDYSHEYHLPCSSGKDSITFCQKCNTDTSTSIIATTEIAHTFQLGDVFTSKFRAQHRGKPLTMNCYGIGIGRLIAALIEVLSPTSKVMRLPYVISPFKVAVILPNRTQPNTLAFAEDLIEQLMEIPSLSDDIFVDDRLDNSIGRRLIMAANLGIPHIIVVGNRTTRSMISRPIVEYFRTEPKSEEPISIGDVTCSEIFEAMQGL